jgi:hypothetical protein
MEFIFRIFKLKSIEYSAIEDFFTIQTKKNENLNILFLKNKKINCS